MIAITESNGDTAYIAAATIARLEATGAGDQYRGNRCAIVTREGIRIVCRQTPAEVIARIAASDAQANPAATLRDQFAMAAITGLHANPACDEWLEENFADAAYKCADAMLAERQKGGAQ